MKRIRLHRFADLSPEIEDALAAFPGEPEWPLELYRSLVEQVAPDRRAIFLCTEDDAVAGVMAMAQDDRGTWEPVTHWILPGWLGPVPPSMARSVAAAMPVRSRFAWWRMSEPVPERAGNVRTVNTLSTFAMDTAGDFESYWKSTGQLRSVAKARNRCENLVFSVNQPGAAQWVITRSDELWRSHSDRPSAQMHARIAAAAYLEPQGKHVTLTLQDGEKWVAGDTYLVHRGDLVAVCAYRDRAYDHFGVGNRLLDLAFHWARDARLSAIDIGGGYAYKERWAPPAGTKSTLLVSPLLPYLRYRGAKALSAMSALAREQAGRALRLARPGRQSGDTQA